MSQNAHIRAGLVFELARVNKIVEISNFLRKEALRLEFYIYYMIKNDNPKLQRLFNIIISASIQTKYVYNFTILIIYRLNFGFHSFLNASRQVLKAI